MPEPKTKENAAPVADFLNAIPNAQVREDCWTIARIMEAETKAKPRMWGSSIVGFGNYRYFYADGRQADWPLTGFSPRKQNITLYLTEALDQFPELMSKLGVHSCGKSCLYIKRLSDVHLPTFKKLVKASIRQRTKANAKAAAR